MSNKERKKEISKQPIPTIEECLGFYKELTNLADVRFVPYYKMAIKALDQEPRKDEVILTKKEYGELVSSEFDNGYTKGYTEALEQNDVLDKIRAEIDSYCSDNRDRNDGLYIAMRIIDKYRESEDKE